MNKLLTTAERLKNIEPFYVMAILEKAKALEAQGKNIIHMEVGEPDFVTPQPIIDAAKSALDAGHVHYTPALGLPELRQAIAQHYYADYDIQVPIEQIAVTSGASSGLLLALAAILNIGDEVLISDPGYPCNRHFATLLGARPIQISLGSKNNYQLNLENIKQHCTAKTKAIMLASPANPTGAVINSKWLSL